MKFIRYDAIKNWKSNNVEDIIDVTDEIPKLLDAVLERGARHEHHVRH